MDVVAKSKHIKLSKATASGDSLDKSAQTIVGAILEKRLAESNPSGNQEVEHVPRQTRSASAAEAVKATEAASKKSSLAKPPLSASKTPKKNSKKFKQKAPARASARARDDHDGEIVRGDNNQMEIDESKQQRAARGTSKPPSLLKGARAASSTTSSSAPNDQPPAQDVFAEARRILDESRNMSDRAPAATTKPRADAFHTDSSPAIVEETDESRRAGGQYASAITPESTKDMEHRRSVKIKKLQDEQYADEDEIRLVKAKFLAGAVRRQFAQPDDKQGVEIQVRAGAISIY